MIITLMKRFLFIGLLNAAATLWAQDSHLVDLTKGKKLYEENCKSCHGINKRLIGPNLPDSAGLKMDKIDPTWIFKWIRNSQGLIRQHDTAAVKAFIQYNRIEMPSFPTLTDDDIRSIGAYTMKESHRLDSLKKIEAITLAKETARREAQNPAKLSTYFTFSHLILAVLIFALIVIIFILLKVFNLLTAQLGQDEKELRRLRKWSKEHKRQGE